MPEIVPCDKRLNSSENRSGRKLKLRDVIHRSLTCEIMIHTLFKKSITILQEILREIMKGFTRRLLKPIQSNQ